MLNSTHQQGAIQLYGPVWKPAAVIEKAWLNFRDLERLDMPIPAVQFETIERIGLLRDGIAYRSLLKKG